MKKIVGTIVIMLLLVGLILGYYFGLMKRGADANAEGMAEESAAAEMTHVQKLISEAPYQIYPATPVQLIKRYNEISTCFYNETCSEAELNTLATMLRSYFDDELKAQQTDAEYLEELKKDLIPFYNQGITIYSAAVSPSTDVEYFDHEGYECARLYCTYTIKALVRGEVNYAPIQQVFILRKDADGHWKIFGFKDVSDVAPAEEE